MDPMDFINVLKILIFTVFLHNIHNYIIVSLRVLHCVEVTHLSCVCAHNYSDWLMNAGGSELIFLPTLQIA